MAPSAGGRSPSDRGPSDRGAADRGPTDRNQALAEKLRMNIGAVFARASVRVKASFRESSWVIGETVFPFLSMSAFVLVYRGLNAPREYEGFVVLGGAMIAYWNNVIWGMASQFFWEREQGQLQLYLITPVSRMSITLGLGWMVSRKR